MPRAERPDRRRRLAAQPGDDECFEEAHCGKGEEWFAQGRGHTGEPDPGSDPHRRPHPTIPGAPQVFPELGPDPVEVPPRLHLPAHLIR
jgi:hypothetical protein